MKSVIKYALVAFLALGLFACTDIGEREAPVNLKAEPTSFDVAAGKVKFEMSVITDAIWDVKGLPDWIHLRSVSPDKAWAYKWNLSFECDANVKYNRTGSFIVTDNTGHTENINIEQAGSLGKYQVVSSVALAVSKLTLRELDQYILKPSLEPENADAKSLVWSSSDPDVATVSAGVVHALRAGSAVITVTSEDGNAKAECAVTVVCDLLGVRLENHSYSLKIGETLKLGSRVLFYPDRASDKSVGWSSSDTKVATVTETGDVTAVASGTAEIRVTSVANAELYDVCTVEVDIADLVLNATSLDMVVEDTFDLVASEPSGVPVAGVNWTTTDADVASVDGNGHVVALSAGNAVIYATTQKGGHQAFCTVNVRNKVDKITMSQSSADLLIGGGDLALSVELVPKEAADYVTIVWASRDETVATVDQSGKVTPLSCGTAVITASTTDGKVFDTCTVSVKQPVTAVSLSPETQILWTNGEHNVGTVTVTLFPDNADDKSFNVVYSNTASKSIVRFSVDGQTITVEPLKAGKAEIDVAPVVRLGYLYKSFEVEVRSHVESVSIDGDESRLMNVGETLGLKATVLPADAYDKSIKSWGSDNTDVATVDSNGKVTAKAPGDAVITVTTIDGEKTASCKVTVAQPVTGNPAPVAVPQYVDLGLPSGLKWATFNVGATKPEEYGDYFAWGETEAKNNYNWSTYKFELGTDYNGPFSKYVTKSSYGTVDNKTVLDLEDDAVHVNWGGSWRMPTDAEWTELKNNCTWTWTSQNGVNGRKVTGPNGNSIFLPAAGCWYNTVLSKAGSRGSYWSSSLNTGYPYGAWRVYFYSGYIYRDNDDRCNGFSVRPVYGEFIPVASVSLNQTSLDLCSGDTYQFTSTVNPSNATVKVLRWISSSQSVVTVDEVGRVKAVGVGSATITVFASSGVSASCTVTVKKEKRINGYEYVDLGLPSGLKWATMNVGASSPEEYGDYFAWGETEAKNNYNWSTYKFELGTDYNGPFSKYVTQSSYGTVDNKTVLDLEDDAAHVNWGGSWRMPTDAEWTELRNNCTWTWTSQNGVNGRKVTGPNGNSIFLPAAGRRDDAVLDYAGSYGLYWSSSLRTDYPDTAWDVGFHSGNVYRGGIDVNRFLGVSVRPVF